MKISINWLRSFVNLPLTDEQLCEQLTQAGLEIESITKNENLLPNIVVGLILNVEKHPDADRLRICSVDVGDGQVLQIVCGASNARNDIKVPVALVDAVLPNGMQIKKAKLRGIESSGMLCSDMELGLTENSSGLMELSSETLIGTRMSQYLELNDTILEIAITPNRGDCLSVLGIAREVKAINGCELNLPTINPVLERGDATKIPLTVTAEEACPRYVGMVLRNIDNHIAAPIWLKERLRKSGIRSINAVVDILNYVMLEMGQPLHAFDLNKLSGNMQVRLAQKGEKIELLDSSVIELNTEDLVIGDQNQVLALAGIMGGKAAEVTLNTTDVFLEGAFFASTNISKSARVHGLHTEASHRFERGVDPNLPELALQRALNLLQTIVGGLIEQKSEISSAYFPSPKSINLRLTECKRLIGIDLDKKQIISILSRLNMEYLEYEQELKVSAPSYRFDIKSEIDLIEEIARIYGYEKIAAIPLNMCLFTDTAIQNFVSSQEQSRKVIALLVAAGYSEVVNYSFIDPKLQQLFDPDKTALLLSNPIAIDAAAMRTSLIPGLIQTALYNQNRQQKRMLFFEIGSRFLREQDNTVFQPITLAAIRIGTVEAEQWGKASQDTDFFDIKNDVENILRICGCYEKAEFRSGVHEALHSANCALIYIDNQLVGYVGKLHPKVQKTFEINQSVYCFEIDLSFLCERNDLKFKGISRFPYIERDLAIIVDKKITWLTLEAAIKNSAGCLLQEVKLFDVYCGKGIAETQKSLALHLIFQRLDGTLTEEEIDAVLKKIILILEQNFNAKLRS